MKHIQLFAFFVSMLGTSALGCSEIVPCDNQINLPSHIEDSVNPKPVQRNFLQNNSSHKILIAVVDTGIDYNHPALLDSIHFKLDIHHQPFRLGWDFIGKDRWPCPYIGRRTAISDFELDSIDKLIEEDGTSFSTALAANACAKLWIDSIKLAPSDIIKELIKRSDTVFLVSH